MVKQKHGIEWEYNEIDKLYYNHFTEKWVRHPRIQKGKFKGQSIGKAVGQSIGKAKGKSVGKNKGLAVGKSIGKSIGKNKDKKYKELYSQMRQLYPDFETEIVFKLKTLPTSEIITALNIYKDSDTKWFDYKYDLEIAEYLISTILLKYSYHKQRKEKRQFVDIPKEDLMEISHHINFYLNALTSANIIECDNIYYNFSTHSKAFGYKINDKYFERATPNESVIQIEPLNIWRLKVKALQIKINKRNELQSNDIEPYLYKMATDVITLLQHLDLNEFEQYYRNPDHFYEFYDITNPTEKGRVGSLNRLKKTQHFVDLDLFLIYIRNAKDSPYFNVKDVYGERFHSPLTNVTKKLRKFIQYNGVKYEELDIVNSQMAFFALMFSSTNEVQQIIPEFETQLNIIKHNRHNEDIKLFNELSMDGKVYEHVSECVNVERQKVKRMMFATLFSSTWKSSHEELHLVFNTLIKLTNNLNKKYNKIVPKMCQRLESRIMIRTVAKEFSKVSKYPFYTVHDSVGFHPEEKELFVQTYLEVFQKFNIIPLKLK